MKFRTIRSLVGVCAAVALSTAAHAQSSLGDLSNWTYLGNSNFSFSSLSEKAGTKFDFALVGESTGWSGSQQFYITDGAAKVKIFDGPDTTGAAKAYTVASQLNGITFDSNNGVKGQYAPNGSGTDFAVYRNKANANLYGFAYEDYCCGVFQPDYNDMVVTMSVTPVPEPETYALLMGGLGVLGLLSRRRAPKA